MSYLKLVGTSVIWIYTALLVVTFFPGIPPYGDFSEYEPIEPKSLKGNLAINNRLNVAEKLFQGQVDGPEAFAQLDGEIYTGLLNGKIIKITKNKLIETVFKIGEKDEETNLFKSGRPLALKFDKKGLLYVTDLVFGIFKIDVKNKKAELIIDARKKIEGKRATANALALASNGDIYWSDSCAGFQFEGNFLPIVMLNPCGRLIRYSAETKRNEVLVRHLGVANGVALAKDESFVLVAECSLMRIIKYHLKGSKSGQHEFWMEHLPGNPDNIVSDNGDGFLVNLPVYMDADNWSYMQLLPKHPYVRKCIARLPYVLTMPFEYINKFYPAFDHQPFVNAIHHLFTFFMGSPISAILRVDKSGKVIDAAYATNGLLPGLSSAHIFGNDLWIGSFKASHIGKIPVKQAFPTLA